MSYGTEEEILEKYNYYKDRTKDMPKEKQIEWLEDIEFNINMIDRWQTEDWICIKAISKLLEEIKEN